MLNPEGDPNPHHTLSLLLDLRHGFWGDLELGGSWVGNVEICRQGGEPNRGLGHVVQGKLCEGLFPGCLQSLTGLDGTFQDI